MNDTIRKLIEWQIGETEERRRRVQQEVDNYRATLEDLEAEVAEYDEQLSELRRGLA